MRFFQGGGDYLRVHADDENTAIKIACQKSANAFDDPGDVARCAAIQIVYEDYQWCLFVIPLGNHGQHLKKVVVYVMDGPKGSAIIRYREIFRQAEMGRFLFRLITAEEIRGDEINRQSQ